MDRGGIDVGIPPRQRRGMAVRFTFSTRPKYPWQDEETDGKNQKQLASKEEKCPDKAALQG